MQAKRQCIPGDMDISVRRLVETNLENGIFLSYHKQTTLRDGHDLEVGYIY